MFIILLFVPLKSLIAFLLSRGSSVIGSGIVLWFHTVRSTRRYSTEPWKQICLSFLAKVKHLETLLRLSFALTYTRAQH